MEKLPVSFSVSQYLDILTLFIARKHDARFLVSDVTVQYGHGVPRKLQNFKRKYTSQHARNITETKDKTDFEKWPKSLRHPPRSSPPCTSKTNDKLPFFREVGLGMPTTNPRIKLFNGKAGSSELFFGKRDVLGFPIHFARPPADKSGGWFTSGGGCRVSPPSLLPFPPLPALGILPVLQDVPVNHHEISSDSSGTLVSMPLAAGNFR